MLNEQQKNWIIVGLAVGQSTRNCRRWPIFVKHVVASTKWANALVLVFAILCTWNRFREICAGNFLYNVHHWVSSDFNPTTRHFPHIDICIHDVGEAVRGVARDHHNGTKDVIVPEIVVARAAEIDVNDPKIVKVATNDEWVLFFPFWSAQNFPCRHARSSMNLCENLFPSFKIITSKAIILMKLNSAILSTFWWNFQRIHNTQHHLQFYHFIFIFKSITILLWKQPELSKFQIKFRNLFRLFFLLCEIARACQWPPQNVISLRMKCQYQCRINYTLSETTVE